MENYVHNIPYLKYTGDLDCLLTSGWAKINHLYFYPLGNDQEHSIKWGPNIEVDSNKDNIIRIDNLGHYSYLILEAIRKGMTEFETKKIVISENNVLNIDLVKYAINRVEFSIEYFIKEKHEPLEHHLLKDFEYDLEKDELGIVKQSNIISRTYKRYFLSRKEYVMFSEMDEQKAIDIIYPENFQEGIKNYVEYWKLK
jgi:hypothetical protein